MLKYLFTILAATFIYQANANSLDTLFINDPLDRVTTCEIKGGFYVDGNISSDTSKVIGGLKFKAEAPTNCFHLAQRIINRNCRKLKRQNPGSTIEFNYRFGFKVVQENTNPDPSPCTGPNDPQCFDSGLTQYKMVTIDAGILNDSCTH